MEKMYFGHPVNTYNTDEEKRLIETIELAFPEFEIENPNQPIHAENYQKWKKERGNGMLYFFEEVLSKIDAGIFLPFEDLMFGAGVYKEANFLGKANKQLFEINHEGLIKKLILNESRALSVEETRKRVYG